MRMMIDLTEKEMEGLRVWARRSRRRPVDQAAWVVAQAIQRDLKEATYTLTCDKCFHLWDSTDAFPPDCPQCGERPHDRWTVRSDIDS